MLLYWITSTTNVTIVELLICLSSMFMLTLGLGLRYIYNAFVNVLVQKSQRTYGRQ